MVFKANTAYKPYTYPGELDGSSEHVAHVWIGEQVFLKQISNFVEVNKYLKQVNLPISLDKLAWLSELPSNIYLPGYKGIKI